MQKFYDKDDDGSVSYPEFINGLLDGGLSKRKAAIVETAWNSLNGGESVSGQAIADALNANVSEKVILNLFDGTTDGVADKKVSKDEFIQFYKELALQVPNDDAYETLVESQWSNVQAREVDKLDKEAVMRLVNLLRQRLITVSNGKQENSKLEEIFRRFDVDKS